MTTLFLDLETYSEEPISSGVYKYAERAEVMLLAYAFDDEPVRHIDLTADPNGFVPSMLMVDKIVIHNASFDVPVLRHALGIDLPLERVHCTMAQALAHGLPGSLGDLCDILGVDTDKAKDKDGRKLINLFCKPRPKNMTIRRATNGTHPEEWARFVDYAKRDIEATRQIYNILPRWNYSGCELELWRLDQRINRRGFAVDTKLAEAAIRAVDSAQASLTAQTCAATSGAVSSTNQRDALLRYVLNEHGVELPDLQGATLERRINDPELPEAVRELLAIRLQASTTSTSKYKKLIAAVSSDGRLRGTLQFCGASRTGRWSGRTFQPQNLPSNGLPPQKDIDNGIEAIKNGVADLVVDNVMAITSAAIRGCIVASPGKKLVVSDLSNIEGRVAAWLAGEQWKLQAFRDFDAGTGVDLYKLAYAKSFGIAPEAVDKQQRQIGKVQELALGYEGGVGAFLTFAAVYGIDLDAMADDAGKTLPITIWGKAADAWQWAHKNNRTYGLRQETYIVCDAFKRMWREAHPAISSYWKELEDCAIEAVMTPGKTFTARKIKCRRDGGWLRLVLPSGRAICYASPKIEAGKLTYMGVNQYTRKWSRLKTYGGKLFENCCQAAARDVMAANMPRIEDSGYDIVLTVHDELVTEAVADQGLLTSAEHLSELLAAHPAWAPDLPLAAGGFEATRYKKG
jgi:DNA polymerase